MTKLGLPKVVLHYTYTLCPRSSDAFYVVSYNIKWVTTFWTQIIFKYIFLKSVKTSNESRKKNSFFSGPTAKALTNNPSGLPPQA